MNEIATFNFNEELLKLATESVKEAGASYNLKIPKKMVGRLGTLGVGAGLGAVGMDMYQDMRTGAAIRKQQNF